MPFRFRRSIRNAPGIRLNAGRRGVSTSATLPGTGISYTLTTPHDGAASRCSRARHLGTVADLHGGRGGRCVVDRMVVTRIVSTSYRYKPRKRAKAAVIESSAVITANRRRMLAAQVVSNAGVVLTVLAGLIPLVASDRAFRWLLALGLVFVGGICMAVAHRLAPRSSAT